MHPEIKDILMAIGCRDVDLLNAHSSCLVMRPLHTDLDEEAELRVLFQGSCGTADPIAAVIVLPPPSHGEPPVRVPLSASEAQKWDVICDVYRQDSAD
ncbi:hypothetical protein [Synechococcus sp. HK01-R]|uniref:hypothetical protein n=1 Tax=Synechococcus sp. HK01-R TaxID=2751171 RepID=UPI001625142B|nr:hypothetical protein [Synechococcus sp. HK01-R]QNG26428.1 hypothetical protein H0O21_09140 [Synechococcus sp. HK01-R]